VSSSLSPDSPMSHPPTSGGIPYTPAPYSCILTPFNSDKPWAWGWQNVNLPMLPTNYLKGSPEFNFLADLIWCASDSTEVIIKH
jgi:hypothetical protein